MTGIALLVLLAAEGITILRIHRLLPAHFFIGLLLIPPVVLKMTSTGYRFVRYYMGDPDYRRAGPPPPLLRLVAPESHAIALGQQTVAGEDQPAAASDGTCSRSF